ncbi:hypothetical protein ACFE33_00495 [Falsihalocynthiibacter sp. SS001]|uniref:hypothetical protein n=1 Tax=Falsihalocynthiibacter sp. SS001 TaxID=3349698 RepID=UPI0036D307B0
MADKSVTHKDVLLDPEKFYSNPAEVSSDARWSDPEKREILLAWKSNEQALLRAANEGLDGGERPHLARVIKELNKFETD